MTDAHLQRDKPRHALIFVMTALVVIPVLAVFYLGSKISNLIRHILPIGIGVANADTPSGGDSGGGPAPDPDS